MAFRDQFLVGGSHDEGIPANLGTRTVGADCEYGKRAWADWLGWAERLCREYVCHPRLIGNDERRICVRGQAYVRAIEKRQRQVLFGKLTILADKIQRASPAHYREIIKFGLQLIS